VSTILEALGMGTTVIVVIRQNYRWFRI